MVLSRVGSNRGVLKMAIEFKYFSFDQKAKWRMWLLEILDGFSLVWVPCTGTQSLCFYIQVTVNFKLWKMNISNSHSNANFAHFSGFHCQFFEKHEKCRLKYRTFTAVQNSKSLAKFRVWMSVHQNSNRKGNISKTLNPHFAFF